MGSLNLRPHWSAVNDQEELTSSVPIGRPLSGPNSVFVALRRLGRSVEYRIYGGEGHVITRKANVVDFWGRRLEFLAEHLNLIYDTQGYIDFEASRLLPRVKFYGEKSRS